MALLDIQLYQKNPEEKVKIRPYLIGYRKSATQSKILGNLNDLK